MISIPIHGKISTLISNCNQTLGAANKALQHRLTHMNVCWSRIEINSKGQWVPKSRVEDIGFKILIKMQSLCFSNIFI